MLLHGQSKYQSHTSFFDKQSFRLIRTCIESNAVYMCSTGTQARTHFDQLQFKARIIYDNNRSNSFYSIVIFSYRRCSPLLLSLSRYICSY